MGVDKLLQKSIVYFITVIYLLLPFHKASAYDGLLHLQPLYSGKDINSGILVSTATDGNLNTTHTIGIRNSQTGTLFYHFGSPVTINAYQISSSSVMRIYLNFYDANKVLIKSIHYTEIFNDGVKHDIEPVSNVSYVALHNVSTVQVVIKEFDVFGSMSPDTTAPAIPTDFTGTGGDGSASLDWNDNNEADLQGYNVYQSTDGVNFTKITASPITTSNYHVTGLTNGITYYFAVTAVDTSGNESARSPSVSVTFIPPPEEVADVRADAKYDRVKLSWTRPESEFFSYVKIYRKKIERQSFWDQLFGTTAVSAETTSDGYTPMF